jgi:hypothetical protein
MTSDLALVTGIYARTTKSWRKPGAGAEGGREETQSVTYIRERGSPLHISFSLSLSLSSRWRRLDGEKVEEKEENNNNNKELLYSCVCVYLSITHIRRPRRRDTTTA